MLGLWGRHKRGQSAGTGSGAEGSRSAAPASGRGADIYLHLIREQAKLRAEFYNTVAAGLFVGGMVVPILQSPPSADLATFVRFLISISVASSLASICRKLATLSLNEIAYHELEQLTDTMAGIVSARIRPTEIPAGIAETARSLDRLGAEMDENRKAMDENPLSHRRYSLAS
jgi:hypothetical protein